MASGCGALRAAGLVLVLGCSTPYQPATAPIAPWPPDAFSRVLGSVRVLYPRLSLVDAQAFLIQSEWMPHERGEATGERRASVFRDGQGVGVVVETRYLILSPSPPHWSAVKGDVALERELLSALERALLGR